MTDTIQSSAVKLAGAVIEPLCDASARLLAPVRLSPNDRLYVTLSDDGDNFIIQPYATVDGRSTIASYEASYKWLARIPERKELGGNRHQVAATDTTALIIASVWTADRIDWDGGAKDVFDYVLLRFMSQTAGSQVRAAYKLRGVLPDMPATFIDHPEKPLAPYQRAAFAGAYHQEGAALYMEQGTGKTPICIARICTEAHELYMSESVASKKEKRKRRLYTVLIACPKNVRQNWLNEVHSFATVPGKVVVLRGGQITRLKLLVEAIQSDSDSEFAVVICSYESVRRSWNCISMNKWHLVISDESHYIAAPTTDRTQTFLKLRECADQRMVLTGTPVKQRLVDLWSQFEFLGQGLSGFTSAKKYADFYGQFDDDKKDKKRFLPPMAREAATDKIGSTDINKYSNIPLLQERLSRLAFMITKKEALPELPDKSYDIHEVEMLPAQREAYIKLMSQLALELEEEMQKKTVTAQNILVKMLRLTQITSGFVVFDRGIDEDGNPIDEREVKTFNPNPKIQAVLDLMEDKPKTSKTIIWACFRHDIAAISEALTKAGYKNVTYTGSTSDEDRGLAERSFNEDPECRVFIGNAGAGGTGVNLRGYNPDWEGTEKDHGCNCDHVIYYSQDWSMVKRAQSEDRAHRRGTRVPVRYTDIVVPGTVDEEIRTRVTQKGINAMQLQDVREIMKKVLSSVPEND